MDTVLSLLSALQGLISAKIPNSASSSAKEYLKRTIDRPVSKLITCSQIKLIWNANAMHLDVADNGLWKKVNLRQQDERDQKRKAIIRTAGQLFAEHGAHRTSLNDIAERLNITKPALYHYFKSKNEILFECYKLGAELTENALNQIEQQCPNGLEKVRAYIQIYIAVLIEEMGTNVILFDDRDLEQQQRQAIKQMRRNIQNRLKSYITEGIQDDSIKDCDITLITNTISGAINGISYWYKSDGKLSSEQIAEQMSDYLLSPLIK